ncbi:MAG: cytochrome C oxidase subunit I [Burkholderiaceae bacterium]|nr:cytochrome C oxidase subunit I [Burkholderiaceae bacterium]
MTTATQPLTPAATSHWRRFRTLYLLIAVCTAPVIASYLMYYVFPPGGRTNYGDLIVPQRPTPALALQRPDGTAFDLKQLRGSWLMVKVDGADCAESCRKQLWLMRQLRTMQGKDADRIERVFLVTGEAPLAEALLREVEGTVVLRARRAELEGFLPAADGARREDHIFLIDPLGNLMLRWPNEADPSRMKRDLGKLLKASRIG